MVDLVVSSLAVNFLVEDIQVVSSLVVDFLVERDQVVGLEAFERRRVWSFVAC
jgi:hypothetical protein